MFFTYIFTYGYVYVCAHRHIRLVQQDRQGILMYKQPQTLVFRMEA